MIGGGKSPNPLPGSGGSDESPPSAHNAFDFVVSSPQAGRERAETTRLADLHSAPAARGGKA